MPQPTYILFAGVNGAGKSTLYRSGLWQASSDEAGFARINSDEIVVSHGWDPSDQLAQIRAGKEALAKMEQLIEGGQSFNRETTLSGRTIMKSIKRTRALGYRVVMHYVGVEDVSIALERIAHRVSRGGHNIAQEDVLRRAMSSEKNLLESIGLCDEVSLFDNTEALRFVARFRAGSLSYYDDFPLVEWVDRVVHAAASQTAARKM